MPKRKVAGDNIDANVDKIKEIVDGVVKSDDSDAMSALIGCLDKEKEKLMSVILVKKIKKRFLEKIDKMEKANKSSEKEVLEVLKRCECNHKQFERMDYRVSSNTSWTITLPDGSSTAFFSCFYDGDNEGSGSYGWRCEVNDVEDGEEDLDDYSDANATEQQVWEALGLTSKANATMFYRDLFGSSIF